MKHRAVGLVALSFSVCIFSGCAVLFVYGANKGYDYRYLPNWFTSDMDFFFFGALSLGLLSVIGLVVNREKKFLLIALLLNFLTTALVGLCTTPN